MAINLEMLGNYTSPLRKIGAQVSFTSGSDNITLKENDKLKSLKIDRVINNSKFFGYGISQKLTVKALDADKEINLSTDYCGKVGYRLNDEEYVSGSPEFKITELHRDEVSGELSITAYDALYNLKDHVFADLGLTAPYNLRDVAEAIGGKIGARGVDSNHFSPNLVKPVDEWSVAQGATKSDGWINLPKSGAYAHYYIPWNYRTDTFYIKATFNSDEEVYGYYIGLQLLDDTDKVISTVAAKYSSEVSGEQIVTITASAINKANLKKTKRMRIFMNYRAAACRFKDVIVSFKDTPYIPYGSDYAQRNLTPFDKWKLNAGATRDEDGTVLLNTTNQYIEYNIPWNCRGDKFFFKITFDSDEETYGYLVATTFFDVNNKQILHRNYTEAGKSGEFILEFDNDVMMNSHKALVAKTKRIRFYIARNNSNTTVPYKIKNVMFSENPINDYVGDEGAPFTLTYETGANYEGTETLQEVLNDIAEVTQTIYFINNSGTLYFKKLNVDGEPVATIDKNMYISLDSGTNKYLSKVISATELGDNLEAARAESGSTQVIMNNGFWDLREDRAQLVENALAAVGGLTINQFTCSWRGFPFFEPGDKLAFTTKDDNTIISYLLDDSIEYDGALSQASSWKYENTDNDTGANPTTIGEAFKSTYAKVDKVNQRIELVAQESEDKYAQLVITTDGIKSDVKDANTLIDGLTTRTTTNETNIAQTAEQIELKASKEEVETVKTELGDSITTVEKSVSDLSVSAEGIAASVQSLTTIVETNADGIATEIAEINKKVDTQITDEDVTFLISSEIKKGVDKVETSTGYRFDDTGLTVSKTNSEMKTQITEDGMVVYKNNEAVLTANNSGVDAKNLHATTYLIVGKYSRFEDMPGKQRTGCFWVGGA